MTKDDATRDDVSKTEPSKDAQAKDAKAQAESAKDDSAKVGSTQAAAAAEAAPAKAAPGEARGQSKSAASASGGSTADLRWIGYLGGVAIIAVSLLNITGERNMFAPAAVSTAGAEPAKAASGPCESWKTQLCEGVGGEKADACVKATGALDLLSDAACTQQLKALPAKLAEIAATRADCTNLMDRLCTDLGDGTETCQMVRSRTLSFPAARCTEMLGQYDKVLGELKRMQERAASGAPGMPGMPGAPGGLPVSTPPVVKAAAPAHDPHDGHDHSGHAHAAPGAAAPREPAAAASPGASAEAAPQQAEPAARPPTPVTPTSAP